MVAIISRLGEGEEGIFVKSEEIDFRFFIESPSIINSSYTVRGEDGNFVSSANTPEGAYSQAYASAVEFISGTYVHDPLRERVIVRDVSLDQVLDKSFL